MNEESGPYWVDASLESEEMEERVWRAMDEASYVRSWAVEELNARWHAATGYPTTAELVPAMTQFLKGKSYGLQRYSLLAILNSTVTAFNRMVREEKLGDIAIVNLPKIEFSETIELTFQARSVWPKYIMEHSRLSTVYGSVFLEGEWNFILAEQALSLRIPGGLFPYLCYSASLKTAAGLYQVRFNVHQPASREGKKLTRKKKVRERWAA